MEQRNFILAVVLSIGFLFLWSVVVMPRFAPRPPAPGTVPAAASATPEIAPVAAEAIRPAHRQDTKGTVGPNQVLRDAENEIVLSPRGGAVRHWRMTLKNQDADLVLNPEGDVLPL